MVPAWGEATCLALEALPSALVQFQARGPQQEIPGPGDGTPDTGKVREQRRGGLQMRGSIFPTPPWASSLAKAAG